MRLEDPLYHASLTRKRKLADPSEGDYADRTKQRLEDSFEFNTSTSTSLDQVDSKNRLLWSIFKNKAVLESTGSKKKIIPILNRMGKTSQMDKTGYVWIDGSSIIALFINLVKDRDDVDLFTNEDTTKLAKAFEPRDGEARHGIKIGIDEDMYSSLTNADNDAKKILMGYYGKIVSEGVPFRLKPIVDTKSGVKANQDNYFSEPTAAKPFNNRNHENKAVSSKSSAIESCHPRQYKSTDTSAPIKSSEGVQYHNDTLQKPHDESEAAFLKYGEAQRKYDEAKRAIKGNNSKSARSALKAATAAMKATKAVYQIKAKSYSDAKTYTEVDQFSDRQDERTVRKTVNNMVGQVRTTGVGSEVKRKLQGRGLRGAGVARLKELSVAGEHTTSKRSKV
ncbi:unnamed protein product [Phytophthora lilii]|uniref:Unnamed protein product n=1 Tax=Phytophthora lilii TaxID=2077276 RepID=A0A9W7DD34_9STRA|nr:unnamed protein product [Phytophthora lilii]